MAVRWMIKKKWWGSGGGAPRLYSPDKRYQGKQSAGVIDLPDDFKPPEVFVTELDGNGEPVLDEGGKVVRTPGNQDRMALMGWIDPDTGQCIPGKKAPGKKGKKSEE